MMNENEKETSHTEVQTTEDLNLQHFATDSVDKIQVEELAVPEEPIQKESTIISDLTIGQLIRNKRESKGLSLKVISQQTKIHIGLLEHLENDNYSKLPSKTYIRGFVKSTAKILGINQEEALAILETSYNSKAPKKDTKIYHAPPPENSLADKYSNNPSISFDSIKSVVITYASTGLKFGAVFALIAVVGFNLKNYIKNSGKDSGMKLPVVLTTMHQKSKPAPKPVAPKTEVKPTEQTPIQVNLIQENKKEAALQEKAEVVVNDVKLKATPSLEKQFNLAANVSNDKMDEYLPKRFRFPVTKGQESVFINAIDGDSWITYKVDDKEIKKYVLRQGRTVFMRGANIRLFIGNTNNVKVFYNNQLLEINAKSGMKNIVFPEEIKSKYMSPLFVFQKDGTVVTSDEFIKANHTNPDPKQTIPTGKK